MASGKVSKIQTKQTALFAPSAPQEVAVNTSYTLLDSRSTPSYITVTFIFYTTTTATASTRVSFGDIADVAASDHSVGAWVNGVFEEIRYSIHDGNLQFQKLPSTQLYLHRIYAKLVE